MPFKNIIILVVITTLSVLLNLSAFGQAKDWGDVSKDELTMNIYAPDSSASAVVLFDRAEVNFNQDLEYVMERHIRIKILNKKGYDWATETLFYNKELDQDISKVRGQTFTLKSNGKIKKHELSRRAIFEEEVYDDYRRVKFTLPSLEPGAVIEYKYKKHIGRPYLLPDWEFQRSIPVVWCEYNVKIPDLFFYNKLLVGGRPFYINKKESFQENIYFTFKSRSSRGGFSGQTTRFQNSSINISGYINKWVMKDLPAVKELPFMTTADDYKSKLWLQLTEIRIPGRSPERFLKTWNNVAEDLHNADRFGDRLDSNSDTRKAAARLTANLSDPTSKLLAIYDYVTESLVWDGAYTIFTDNDLDDVLEVKKGSSSELNLLLIQLLREAGISAEPVLLSTRNHGKIVEYFAIANQFNHVICSVTIGEKTYLLDATSSDHSVNILPVNDLNGRGLNVSNGKAKWIDLVPGTDTYNRVILNAELNEEGKVKGNVHVNAAGYNGLDNYKNLEENGKEDYLNKDLFGDFTTVSIDSSTLTDRNPANDDFDVEVQFSDLVMKQSQQAEGYLYFNPMLFLQEKENPFVQPQREIPVEFPYTFKKEFIANYTVPETYEIEEVPKSQRFSIPGRGIELTRLVQVSGRRITVLSKFELNKKKFESKEYKALREFYSYVVDMHNSQIVLKKSSPE